MEIRGIRKRYKKKEVLKNINLTLNKGEIVGIIGSNGSGKSTLLSILAGIIKADAGEFVYDNHNLLEDGKLRSKVIGYVPQGSPLIEELTAWDNLLLWYDSVDIRRELEGGVLEMLGIGAFLKTPVRKMSGGMKKRLSIGCSVMNKPDILLLDEPCSALDIDCRENIYNYFSSYLADGGTIIMVTHELYEISMCDSCYILKDGELMPYQYVH